MENTRRTDRRSEGRSRKRPRCFMSCSSTTPKATKSMQTNLFTSIGCSRRRRRGRPRTEQPHHKEAFASLVFYQWLNGLFYDIFRPRKGYGTCQTFFLPPPSNIIWPHSSLKGLYKLTVSSQSVYVSSIFYHNNAGLNQIKKQNKILLGWRYGIVKEARAGIFITQETLQTKVKL